VTNLCMYKCRFRRMNTREIVASITRSVIAVRIILVPLDKAPEESRRGIVNRVPKWAIHRNYSEKTWWASRVQAKRDDSLIILDMSLQNH
jgi:hypothetical protein